MDCESKRGSYSYEEWKAVEKSFQVSSERNLITVALSIGDLLEGEQKQKYLDAVAHLINTQLVYIAPEATWKAWNKMSTLLGGFDFGEKSEQVKAIFQGKS
jgi:hypothetical protein